MRKFTDQLNRTIVLQAIPQRIVSIVPSQTELLFHLGLGDRVVGITKFCIHPEEWYRNKKRVGGTKDVKIDEVKALTPDLIIANKEENDKENVSELMKIAPVWFSDIYNLEDSYRMITEIGKLCAVEEKATDLIVTIQTNFAQLFIPSVINGKKVLYLIWRKPYMAVAQNTFIDHVLTDVLKLENVLKEELRYPMLELAELKQVPDYVFLSSEPYPFNEKHSIEIQQIFPNSKIILVDGEYFSWYGSRLKDAPNYFSQLLNTSI